MTFTGFDPKAIALLANLPSLSPSQYTKVRDLLATGLRQPGLALLQAVAPDLDAALVVDQRRSVSPMQKDLRFAKAGAPRYKDHLLLTTWDGLDKKAAPTLFIRVGADSVGFASGIAFTREIRERFRQAVAGARGEALTNHIAQLKAKYRRHDLGLAGARVKRVPKPWAGDHPRADLLRHTEFQIRFRQPLPKTVGKPAFADFCEARLRDLLPIHTWLVGELGRDKAITAEALFWELAAELQADDPRIAEGTIMNGRCLRVGKEFLALVDYKGSGLVVKLPQARVAALIEQATGRPFAPAGRVFKEWLSVPKPDRQRWRALLREGAAYVGK